MRVDNIKESGIDKTEIHLEKQRSEIDSLKHQLQRVTSKYEEARTAVDSFREKYCNMLHASPIGLLITDSSGYVTEANITARKMYGFGFHSGDLLGRSAKSLFRPKKQTDMDLLFQSVLAGGRAQFFGISSRIDGSLFDVKVFGSPLNFLEQPGILFTILDLTENRRMEKEQNRLTSILEGTPDLVGTADKNGNLFYVNRGGRKLLGLSPDEEVFSHNFREFHPAWAQKLLEDEGFPTAISEGLWLGEAAILHRDGSEIPISQVVIAHRSKTGELEYLSTIIRDLSEIKRTEETLRNSEEKYRTLVETTRTGYVIMDFSGKVLDANPRFVKLTGYDSLEEISGRNFHEWMAIQDLERYNQTLQKCRTEGSVRNLEVGYTPPDASQRTIEMNAAVIDSGERKAIIALCRDVTERKSEELKQKKITLLLEALSSIQTQFIADSKPRSFFKKILNNLLSLTKSNIGFIGEVLDRPGGTFHFKVWAKSNIKGNESLWNFSEDTTITEYRGEPFQSFLNRIVTTKQILVGPNLKTTFNSRGEPESFMGIPFLQGDRVVGMVAIGNRHGGYGQDVVEYLQPFIAMCGSMIDSYQADVELRNTQVKLRSSLDEKEVLLKEIHHRVKNNMQIISSMLRLQSNYIDDETLRSIFRECQNRISSMALIHEMLYQSKDLGEVEFSKYIKNLVNTLVRAYQGDKRQRIKQTVSADQTRLTIDLAVPLGLITNELISNVLKHAFPDQRKGAMEVKFCALSDSSLCIEVSDNGIGMKNFDWENSKSMGLKLIKILTAQINGKLACYHTGGTKIRIVFPKTKDRHKN